ncbi:MAG: hypothetical protein K8J08_17175 [Thermoanaerobaculia bacterium]|nr:hypothetical protein [Thermoanaerobaculia bacterium]
MSRASRVGILGVTCALMLGGRVGAADVKIFRLQDQAAFLRGTLDGVSIDALGTLRLAARAQRLASLEEPFVLSAAKHPEGWVVGTGNNGRVVLVRRDGSQETLFEVDEPEIFALAVDDRGVVYAGSSPDGKIYRFQDGSAEPLASLEQTYIWQIVPQGDGNLLVATGTEGKLFRVGKDGATQLVWDSDDTHVRTLHRRADGTVLAGTAGEGLLVEISTTGRVRTLYDAPEPEVVALTPGVDGVVWAAVLASEASQLPAPTASATAEDDEAEGDTVVVTIEETAVQVVGSRPPGHKGPRSEILRILPSGEVEPVARLADDTVFSMAWGDGRLWVATGLEGRLYSLRQGELVLENDIEERQIVALIPGEGRRTGGGNGAGIGLPTLATSNASAVYELVRGEERTGSYVSPVLDAGQTSQFGSFHYLGVVPSGGSLQFSFRSGSSSEPDGSWSEWIRGEGKQEIGLSSLPAGRFVQWRMVGAARDQSPTLASAELSYRQQNLAPRITKFEVWDPGKIQVPQTFNPGNQIFEPVHPNREGIFTTLETSDADSTQRYKSLWKYGFRTLVWSAADPNSDGLEYTIEVRRDGDEEHWLPLAEELDAEYLSFDVTGLPDGVYRFRLVAVDRPAVDGSGLDDRRQSEPVVIDHSAPEATQIERVGDRIRIDVKDAWNPLRRAEFSVDAGEWRPAPVEDGLLDSRRERLWVPIGKPDQLLVLRLMDAAFNTVTLDLTRDSP